MSKLCTHNGRDIYGLIVLDQNGSKKTPLDESLTLFERVKEVMGHGLRSPENYPPQWQDDRWYCFLTSKVDVENAVQVIQTMPFKLTICCAYSQTPKEGKPHRVTGDWQGLITKAEKRIRNRPDDTLPARWVASTSFTKSLQEGDLSFLNDWDSVLSEICKSAENIERFQNAERLYWARESERQLRWNLESEIERIEDTKVKLIEARAQVAALKSQ